MKLSSIKSLLATFTGSKKSALWWAAPTTAVVVLVGLVVLAVVIAAPKGASTDNAGSDHLRGQVDTATGAPRDGRDPATQKQDGLAAAASKPAGVGQRTDTPAAGVTGDHDHHHTGSSDTAQTGIGSNGCYIDYGIQGEQCVPAHAATNGVLTCHGVHEHFPDGVKVSGNDRFHLDTNHNGIACDSGDAH